MRFRSKTSPGILLPIVALLGSLLILFFTEKIWAGFFLLLLLAGFIWHMFTTTYYMVKDGVLHIKCGFLYSHTIEIDKIKKLSPTRNPISAPALSLDRIAIRYGRSGSELVSPADKAGFINALLNYNADIEIVDLPYQAKISNS